MCRKPALAAAATTCGGGVTTAEKEAPSEKEAGYLTEAPRPLCVLVCACYCALCARGVVHARRIRGGAADAPALYRDFSALLAIYALETVLAAALDVTTMYHWIRRNFYEHHLPLVVVGGLMLASCRGEDYRPLEQHREWCALILCISLNEAVAALLILWPSTTLQALRLGPNMCVQASLLATESYSYARAVRAFVSGPRDPTMDGPFLLTQFLLVAAAVHVDYIRQIAVSCRKRPRAELDLAALGFALALAAAAALVGAP